MVVKSLNIALVPPATSDEFKEHPSFLAVIDGETRLVTWDELSGWVVEQDAIETGRATTVESNLLNQLLEEVSTRTSEGVLLQNQINGIVVGNKAYLTYSAMVADSTNIPNNSKIEVVADPTPTNNGTYSYNAGVFTKASDLYEKSKLYTDGEITELRADIDGVILQTDTGDINFISRNGVLIAQVSKTGGLKTKAVTIQSNVNNEIEFLSKNGVLLKVKGHLSIKDGTELINTVATEVVDERLAQFTPIDTKQVLFTNQLVGWSGEDTPISVAKLLTNKIEQQKKQAVLATVSARNSYYYKEDRQLLNIDVAKLGTQSTLTLQDMRTVDITKLNLSTYAVPKSGLVGSPKVLMIGDSIMNRGGAVISFNNLTSSGLTPTMIGTMVGTGTNQSHNDIQGKLNEGREGWKLTDFTYLDTRYTPVTNPTAYLALDKATKNTQNPFIRVATGADPTSDVVNGYILDFAKYSNDFSVQTPDVVVIQLGTNDMNTYGVLASQNISVHAPILLRRIRGAWSNTKIIVSFMGYGHGSNYDARWQTQVAPIIRAWQKAVTDMSDTKVYFCPAFAIQDTQGYPLNVTSTDAISGATSGTVTDQSHPELTGRQSLYRFISAYIAGSSTNII